MKTLTWLILGFALTLAHVHAHADVIESQVLKIESSANASDASLVYMADGQLVRVHAVDYPTLRKFELVEISGDVVRFNVTHLGSFDHVGDVQVVEPSTTGFSPESFARPQASAQDYQPTDFVTVENAQAQFQKLDPNMRRRSQCYQRAENWAYEMYRSSRVYSLKNFMFFTRKFIQETNYHWWFHVTPVVMVSGVEYTLDRTFTDGALTMQEWTAEFMPKDVTCPVVQKYSEYSEHQSEQLCYHIQVPMYYYQPKNIEELEKGKVVTDFAPEDLAHARRAYR